MPPLAALFVLVLAAIAVQPAPAAEPIPLPTQTPSMIVSTPAPVPTPTIPVFQAFSLSAREIDFYSARYVLTADGDVDVRFTDGTRITGNAFAMDLRLNRFLVAGDVRLYAAGQTYDGAAYADFLDFDRQYFVPVTDEPDRWTYIHRDFAHPYRGRLMPGDTFFLPDVGHDRIFAVAHKVVVQPRESIKFVTPTLNFGLAKLPWPTYFLNFTANPNFAQNSLPGAFVDGPYDAFGGGHSLFSTHLRYDNQNGPFFAYEQHQVSDRHYLVGSISPLTRPFKTYNFLAFDRLSPKLQIQTFFQESAFQSGFHSPLSAVGYANLKITQGLPHSYLQLNADQYWQSLLAQPAVAVNTPGCNNCGGLYFYGDPTHNWVPNHPNDTLLTWTGFQNRVFRKFPHLQFQTRAAAGFAHEGYGLFALNGVSTSTVWNHLFGLNLAAPSIVVIPDTAGLRRDLFLNLTADKQRTWYSIPHHLDQTVVDGTLSIAPDRHVSLLAGYSITNSGDFWGNNQSLFYPSISTYFSPSTGQLYPSWSAFRGFQTQRSLRGQVLYTPSTEVALSLQYRHNHDFPEPIPGSDINAGFKAPANSLSWGNIGVAPDQLTVDLRFRLTPILTIDFTDAYFFNFGGYQKWSPNYQVQVLR